MRIRVDEIPDSGRFLHFHWEEDRLNQFLPPDDPFKVRLVRPVNVDLEIYRRADHVRVQGAIKGMLEVVCHRCLRPFPFPLDETVDLFLVEEPDSEEDEETDPLQEDRDFGFFDGEIIEIDQLVAEQIFLSLPFKVVCDDNCRGLCPGCGANLNEEPCTCRKDAEASAFSALRAIKGRLPESRDE